MNKKLDDDVEINHDDYDSLEASTENEETLDFNTTPFTWDNTRKDKVQNETF